MRTPMIEARDASIYCRIDGPNAQPVVLVHGGPGMPGYTAPLARHLRDSWRVIEYHQRGCGRTRSTGPISVMAHVEDLRAVVRATCGEREPILVGSSWGGILSLCFTATHPGWVRKVVLVGCATVRDTVGATLTKEQRKRLGGRASRKATKLAAALAAETDEGEQNRLFGELWDAIFPLYRCSPDTEPPEFADLCYSVHRRTMRDVVRLRKEGGLTRDFDKIEIPVVAIHGDHDPHPAEEVKATLSGLLPDFRLLLLRNCGHFPWLEPHARALFLRTLRDELQ